MARACPRRASYSRTRSSTRPRPPGCESHTTSAPGCGQSPVTRATCLRPSTNAGQRRWSYQSASASLARAGTSIRARTRPIRRAGRDGRRRAPRSAGRAFGRDGSGRVERGRRARTVRRQPRAARRAGRGSTLRAPMADAALLTLATERATGALGAGGGPDALLARRMQALSLAVHIPIVCFGIAFPAMFLFVHGLYLRTGRPHYKALAKRWSKVALLIFAIGVITGTILSFEFGLLWPDFMATFGEVFGLAFGLEGVSFFVEAIFIAIYVYGWDRLPRRTHFLCGVPVVIAGVAGSFNVIAVNGWMNHPQGFDVVDGQVHDPRPFEALLNDNLWHELVHMYLAGYIVAGFIVAGVYAAAHLRGKRDAYHRTGLVVALSFAALAAPVFIDNGDCAGRTVAEKQPVKLAAMEGLPTTTQGAPFTIGGWYDADTGEVRYGIEVPRMLSLLAAHNPN